MLKILPIASGSSGNCFYLNIDNHQILIDFGVSLKKIKEALYKNNIDINKIDYGFITHKHIDHISGLKVIHKHLDIPYYSIKSCVNYLNKKYETNIFNTLSYKEDLKLDDLTVTTLRVSHDVECCAFIFKTSNHKVSYVTDIGTMNNKILESFKGSDVIVIESNHDIEMLENGTYPKDLINRIESEDGHLSNKECANAINYFYKNGTKNFFLAHLSKENNIPELALNEIAKFNIKPNIYICPIYNTNIFLEI